mmetsp:Transcript_15275/g.38090  ORF Transcript_15275/g.38090 Transcript_15275/m.38090 type:complete len:358 (-) Transcript_15275:792-1865(-)
MFRLPAPASADLLACLMAGSPPTDLCTMLAGSDALRWGVCRLLLCMPKAPSPPGRSGGGTSPPAPACPLLPPAAPPPHRLPMSGSEPSALGLAPPTRYCLPNSFTASRLSPFVPLPTAAFCAAIHSLRLFSASTIRLLDSSVEEPYLRRTMSVTIASRCMSYFPGNSLVDRFLPLVRRRMNSAAPASGSRSATELRRERMRMSAPGAALSPSSSARSRLRSRCSSRSCSFSFAFCFSFSSCFLLFLRARFLGLVPSPLALAPASSPFISASISASMRSSSSPSRRSRAARRKYSAWRCVAGTRCSRRPKSSNMSHRASRESILSNTLSGCLNFSTGFTEHVSAFHVSRSHMSLAAAR